MCNFYTTDMIRNNKWRFVSESDFISEDLYSILDLYQYVDSVIILNEALYNYRHGHESLSTGSRIANYDLIRNFYVQLKELCLKNSYSDNILEIVCEPYLSFSIACMKSIMKEKNYKLKKRKLYAIFDDEELQKILIEKDYVYDTLKRKILYKFITKKHLFLAYCVIKFQARKD